MAVKGKTSVSRTLRRESTDAERLMWARLRDSQLEGFKFRRQHPIGPYIVDFVNLEKKLIIEVDGGHHNDGTVLSNDESRTAWLTAEGYLVLRFWNNEVLTNVDGVLEMIRQAVD